MTFGQNNTIIYMKHDNNMLSTLFFDQNHTSPLQCHTIYKKILTQTQNYLYV